MMKCDYCGKEIEGAPLYDDPLKIYPFCSQVCINRFNKKLDEEVRLEDGDNGGK